MGLEVGAEAQGCVGGVGPGVGWGGVGSVANRADGCGHHSTKADPPFTPPTTPCPPPFTPHTPLPPPHPPPPPHPAVVLQMRIFDGNPEGVVSLKFATKEAADECVALMEGRFFAGRQLEAFKYDGKTNYNVKVVWGRGGGGAGLVGGRVGWRVGGWVGGTGRDGAGGIRYILQVERGGGLVGVTDRGGCQRGAVKGASRAPVPCVRLYIACVQATAGAWNGLKLPLAPHGRRSPWSHGYRRCCCRRCCCCACRCWCRRQAVTFPPPPPPLQAKETEEEQAARLERFAAELEAGGGGEKSGVGGGGGSAAAAADAAPDAGT